MSDLDWFRTKYTEEGLSLRLVAVAAGCSLRTAARWAIIHGVVTRDPKLARQITQTTGAASPAWRGGSRCPDCGGKTSYPISRRRRCMPCSKRGSNNPNYRGVGDVMVLLRQYVRETWSPKILARDRYRCRLCGDAGGRNLVAHHIHRLGSLASELLALIPMATATDRIAAVALLKASPLINDLNNGATLCRTCHQRLHRGRRLAVVPVDV